MFLPATWLGVVAATVIHVPAHAAAADDKIAADLQRALFAPQRAAERWVDDAGGIRMVRAVLLLAPEADVEADALRARIEALGGRLLRRHPATRAITVRLPAVAVAAIAAHPDVLAAAPDRLTRRTASLVEQSAGALTANVRPTSTRSSYTGLDGSGIGIAVLDSGVMRRHEAFYDAAGTSRVARSLNMLNASQADWTTASGSATSLMPGSPQLGSYESRLSGTYGASSTQDAYGHGTHVAAVAAGRAQFYAAAVPDTTGIAPNAKVYDLRVLGDDGTGTMSDAIEGIEWAIYHAKELNIRVLNVSLAASSTQSWLLDPLCAAVRSATAAGLTVVVAAGNYGLDAQGREQFGLISAPGTDPSVITVGSVNTLATATRADDTLNRFSSRGPTRGSRTEGSTRRYDDLLKPDLVAPGNRIVAAAATRSVGHSLTWNALASRYYATLVTSVGSPQSLGETQMLLSGTSVAAPVVSGTVALMLQANPGLTPPLVKAILQYSAEALPGSSLLAQGAGLLNVDGAVQLAKALRTDIAARAEAGTIAAGDPLLAPGRALPAPASTIGGRQFDWARLVTAGGHHVFSGSALFSAYQPIWNPRLAWAGPSARVRTPVYWSGSGIAANTWVKAFTDAAAPNQTLVTAGVQSADALAGPSSWSGASGAFVAAAQLSQALAAGGGRTLAGGLILSEGLVLDSGLILSEGLVPDPVRLAGEGLTLGSGLILSEALKSNVVIYGE